MNKSFLIELEMGGGRKALFTSLNLANTALRKQGVRLVETLTGVAIRALPVSPKGDPGPIPVHGGGYSGGSSRDVRAVQLARKQARSMQAVMEAKEAMKKAGNRVMGETSIAQYGRQGRNKK